MAASVQTRRAILSKLRAFRKSTATPSHERRLRRQGIEGYRRHVLEVVERDEDIDTVAKALDMRALHQDPRFSHWSTEQWHRCARGVAQEVAVRLKRRKTTGDENPVRQLLVALLRKRVLDWPGCSGLVHLMVQSYVWHKAPLDEILSLATRMFDPARTEMAVVPSVSMLRLLLTVTGQHGDAKVFFKIWTSLVKPILQKHYGEKVPISVSTAYIGGCLSFDHSLSFDEVLSSRGSYTSKAIEELARMHDTSPSVGPLLASDLLIRLIRHTQSSDALQLVLNSRLGRCRIVRKDHKEQKTLFSHNQIKQTPLQFLWDGTMSRESYRLGGPVSRTAMLAYLKLGHLQHVMQVVCSHVAAPKPSKVLNTMMQIGDRAGYPQMMWTAFRQMLDADAAPHTRNIRRLLVRLADPVLPYGFRGRLDKLMGFVDSYLPLVSVRDVKALFHALNVAGNMPEVILSLLERMMRPDFDPEERLGTKYPFPVSKHYRRLQKTMQFPLVDHQRWQERHKIDDRWRFRVLLAAGKHLRQQPVQFSKLIPLAEEWLEITTAFRSSALSRGTWGTSTDDSVFSVLLSFLIRPDGSPELLQKGSLFHLMKLGLMAGILPGAKSQRTLHYFTLRVTQRHGRPFKYYRQSYPPSPCDVNEIMSTFDRSLSWSVDQQCILSSILCRYLIEDCFRHITDAQSSSLPLTLRSA